MTSTIFGWKLMKGNFLKQFESSEGVSVILQNLIGFCENAKTSGGVSISSSRKVSGLL